MACGVRGDGDLIRHPHDGWLEGSDEWEPARKVGNGWQSFRDVFGSWNGAIYAQRSDGRVLRYVHSGWSTGDDNWTDPALVGLGAGGYRQVVADMGSKLIVL